MRFFKILICFYFVSYYAFSQNNEFGIKLGGVLPFRGDLKETQGLLESIKQPDSSIGANFGIYTRFYFNNFFVQPELYGIYFKSEYTSTFFGNVNYDNIRIDLPILAGFKFAKIGRFFIGPVFSYVIDDEFDIPGNVQEIDHQELTFGGQVGLGVKLGKFNIDLRYEAALSERNAKFIAGSTDLRPDSRSSILILNFAFNFL